MGLRKLQSHTQGRRRRLVTVGRHRGTAAGASRSAHSGTALMCRGKEKKCEARYSIAEKKSKQNPDMRRVDGAALTLEKKLLG